MPLGGLLHQFLEADTPGRGVEWLEPCPGLVVDQHGRLGGQRGTVGDLGDIMFANLAQYKMIRKGGIKGDSSIHVRFVNDETAFRWVMRVNGDTKPSNVITPTNGSNTLSPFVVLAARA